MFQLHGLYGNKMSDGGYHTAQKNEVSIKDFFSKCGQIRSFLRIWSHILKKSLMENFIFCAVPLTVPTSLKENSPARILDHYISGDFFLFLLKLL